HVQVGMACWKRALETATFEQKTNRGGCYAFSQGGHNPAADKNIFRRHPCSPGSHRADPTSTGLTYKQLSAERALLSNPAILPAKSGHFTRCLPLASTPNSEPPSDQT